MIFFWYTEGKNMDNICLVLDFKDRSYMILKWGYEYKLWSRGFYNESLSNIFLDHVTVYNK